jgi:hypothetical protein
LKRRELTCAACTLHLRAACTLHLCAACTLQVREAVINLRVGDHDNVVRLIGVAVQQAPWLVVLEFVQFGDLRAVLQALKENGTDLHTGEIVRRPTPRHATPRHATPRHVTSRHIASHHATCIWSRSFITTAYQPIASMLCCLIVQLVRRLAG